MKALSLSILGLVFSLSASAAERTLVCEFSDQILSYRDQFVLGENGIAGVTLLAGTMGGATEKVCWSASADAVRYSENSGVVQFEGKLTCADGNTADFSRSVNLQKMETTGPWQGTYPCRWQR